MLASVKGASIITDTTSNRVRKISAFCDGGREDDGRKMFNSSLPKANVNRIGNIVKVYRKESKQTTKPKRKIYPLVKRIHMITHPCNDSPSLVLLAYSGNC